MIKNIDENSGSVPVVAASSFRTSVWVRVKSGARVTLGFDSEETAGENIYLDAGEFLMIGGARARSAIHAVCSTGESAVIVVDAT